MKARICRFAMLLIVASPALAQLPDGYWTAEQSQPILDATLRVTLDPDLSHLTVTESQALEELLAAGAIMHRLYEEQLHRDAAAARPALRGLHTRSSDSAAIRNLRDLYYLFKGPIATTLDNERLPFVPASGEQPGKNVYPFGLTRAQIETAMAANPAGASRILGVRSVVRVAR